MRQKCHTKFCVKDPCGNMFRRRAEVAAKVVTRPEQITAKTVGNLAERVKRREETRRQEPKVPKSMKVESVGEQTKTNGPRTGHLLLRGN